MGIVMDNNAVHVALDTDKFDSSMEAKSAKIAWGFYRDLSSGNFYFVSSGTKQADQNVGH